MPSSRTPRTISSTESKAGPSLTSRQAAPMQKRVAPAARAARRRLEHLVLASSMRSAPTSVSWRDDCGQ